MTGLMDFFETPHPKERKERMALPADLKYTLSHEWVQPQSDGSVSVGITDHAQDMLGDLVFVESPIQGARLKQGEACGVVESVKAASDIYAPLTGEVIAVNTELQTAPEKINQDAYGAWIYQMKPDNPAELDTLLNADQYQKQIDQN